MIHRVHISSLRLGIVLVLGAAVLTGCSLFSNAPAKTESASKTAQLANPASTNCVSKGGTVEIRDGKNGGQVGYCVFADGSECEEWSYFHELCAPSTKTEKQNTETTRTTVQDANEKPVTPAPTPAPAPVATPPESTAIRIMAPAGGAQLSSPVEISGEADLPDGMLTVAFTNMSGKEIFTVPISLRSGKFKGKVSYEFGSTKEGFIRVYATDAAGAKTAVSQVAVTF